MKITTIYYLDYMKDLDLVFNYKSTRMPTHEQESRIIKNSEMFGKNKCQGQTLNVNRKRSSI